MDYIVLMEFLRRVSEEIGHLYTSYFEILLYKQKNIIKAIYAYVLWSYQEKKQLLQSFEHAYKTNF